MGTYKNKSFELDLDTLAPTATDAEIPAYLKNLNSGVDIQLTLSEATAIDGDITYYKAWIAACSSEAEAASEYTIWPDDCGSWKAIEAGWGGKITIPAPTDASGKLGKAVRGDWEIHVQLMDDVGNVTELARTVFSHDATKAPLGRIDASVGNYIIYFDPDAPIATVDFAPGEAVPGTLENATRTATNSFKFHDSDDKSHNNTYSGVGKVTIAAASEAIFTTVSETYKRDEFDGQSLDFTFKSDVESGDYPVTITLEDFAGNVETITRVIHYDKDAANIVVTYKEDTVAGETIAPATTKAAAPWVKTDTIAVSLQFQGDHEGKHDYVSYKLWEDSEIVTVEPATWTEFTDEQKASLNVDLPAIQLTSSNPKILALKVQDHVGNVFEKTVYLKTNTTDPEVSIAFNPATTPVVISNVAGYNTKAVDFTATEGADECPVAYYKIDIINGEGTVLDSLVTGTSGTAGDRATLTAISGLTENTDNKLKLVATDASGRTNSAEISFKYDNTKPEFTISEPGSTGWYSTKPKAVVKVSKDNNNVGDYTAYAWIDDSPTIPGTKPAGAVATTITNTDTKQNIPSANIDSTGLTQGTDNYMHVVLVDAVGNKKELTQKFSYDDVAPKAPTLQFTKTAYNTTAAVIQVSHTGKDTDNEDDTSGVSKIVFETEAGEVVSVSSYELGTEIPYEAAGTWTDFNVVLSGTDGIKHLSAYVIDAAGNKSASSAVVQCELDTDVPTVVTAKLTKPGTDEDKESPTIVKEFGLMLELTNDELIDDTLYVTIAGDLTTTSQKTVPVTKNAEGKWVLNDQTLKCSDGNGAKNVTVTVKDAAGNEITALNQSFTLNVQEINVMVKEDYNTISLATGKRFTSSGGSVITIEGTAWNKVIVHAHIGTDDEIPSTADKKVYEWNAHAYWDTTAAAAGTHDDAYIITGTSGTTPSFEVAIEITGANYQAALAAQKPEGTTSEDGAHIVVVYMKDEAGNWSETASF